MSSRAQISPDIPPNPLSVEIEFIPDRRKEGVIEPDIAPWPHSVEIRTIPDERKEGVSEPDVAPPKSSLEIDFTSDSQLKGVIQPDVASNPVPSGSLRNILVFKDLGVSDTSLNHTLSTLRIFLLPDFAVQTVNAKALSQEPWADNCALLVIPGGAAAPYFQALDAASKSITSYVRAGGSFLGISAGAYYASKQIRWEMGTLSEVARGGPFGFFPGVSKGCVYSGFKPETEEGAKLAEVSIGTDIYHLYHNGGGEFVGTDGMGSKGVEVIGRYTGETSQDKVAAVSCAVGRGRAILWHAHLEYPLSAEPAISLIKQSEYHSRVVYQRAEEMRLKLFRDTLIQLNLRVARDASEPMPRIQPQVLVFRTPMIARLQSKTIGNALHLKGSRGTVKGSGGTLKEKPDTFEFHPPGFTIESTGQDPEDKTKHIIMHDDGSTPDMEKFNIPKYFADLSESRGQRSDFVIGDTLLYGPVVTSTQTMLVQNPILLEALPTPFLSLATQQIQGRGRRDNVWISPPAGGLYFSLLLRLPITFPYSQLVFVQYLFALAVVEACRKFMGPSGEKVRLKWPNDIYALEENDKKTKLGGILVNANFPGTSIDLVIGCGLNVSIPPPLNSLVQLGAQNLTLEGTLATILAVFEPMWQKFVSSQGSFKPFLDLYLERWLHSDQRVIITTIDPPIPVRIATITPKGFLRTIQESHVAGESTFIDLEPDGNSFDLMKGLIRTKT